MIGRCVTTVARVVHGGDRPVDDESATYAYQEHDPGQILGVLAGHAGDAREEYGPLHEDHAVAVALCRRCGAIVPWYPDVLFADRGSRD